ncbi:MAG: FAD-dependent oxidoreductase [Planctomycetes bacterium]|nr:FAD-dependent oxidoreductase [Planctomycetota bacterium]
MFEDRSVDVLVIGGGVVGVCAAYYLRQRGREVTLVEKGEVCSGCSYGNAGLIVPSHSVPLAAPGVMAKGLRWMFNPDSPFYIKPRLDVELLAWLWKFRGACRADAARRAMPFLRDLSRASLELYKELAKLDGLQFDFERKGLLGLYRTEKALKEGADEARMLDGIGIPSKILSPAEIRQIEPGLDTPAIGAVYYPEDAHLAPARFVKGLSHVAGEMGVTLRPGTEVLGFEWEGRSMTRVRTTRGSFRPREVVLACGSWSPGLARGLRLKLPIQPAKGYSVTVRRPAACPDTPLLLAEAKVGVTPMGENLRFAGTLELAGMDFSITERRVQAILRAVPLYLPGLGSLELVEIWRGLRPCTPDGLPFIGRPGAYDNLVVAAGHAMIGVSLGPATGKLVSQIATGEPPLADLTLVRPDRF